MQTSNGASPDPQLDALRAEAGWVLELAKRLARDQAAAEDIAQGTLALALERRPATDGGLRPWLAKVAGRLARRDLRTEARRGAREARAIAGRGGVNNASDEVLMRFELQQELAQRVGDLPEPYRRVLICRYYEGLAVKEIASAAGVSAGTVRSQLSRGLERIRAQYNQDSDGRSALGVFAALSGTRIGLLPQGAAGIVTMQSSTKLVAATAVILIATAAILGPKFLGQEALESGPVEQPLVRQGPAVAQRGAAADSGLGLSASVPGGERVALATGAGPAQAETDPAASGSLTTIRALVRGANGKPLVGAALSSFGPKGPEQVAWTDLEGRAVLQLADGAMRMYRGHALDMVFTVSAAQYATAFVTKRPATHGTTDLGEFQLDPGGAIVGSVTDPNGRPMAGVLVTAEPSMLQSEVPTRGHLGPKSNNNRPTTLSAADGRFELGGIPSKAQAGQPAQVRVWAHAEGHLWTATDPIAVLPHSRLSIDPIVIEDVSAELALDGLVISPKDLPVAGARVEYFAIDSFWAGHTVADDEGRFRILPRDASRMELVAHDPQGKYGMSAPAIAKRGEVLQLRLGQRRTVLVTVKDRNHRPQRDVFLRPVLVGGSDFAEGETRLVPGTRWQNVDDEGQVEVEVPGHPFMVTLKRNGVDSVDRGPFDPDTVGDTLEVILPSMPQVHGRVLAYGQPVDGAQVAIGVAHAEFVSMTDGLPNHFRAGGRPTVETDGNGRFSLTVNPDWPVLPVMAIRDGLAPGEAVIAGYLDEDVEGVEIHLTEGGAIEGAVIPPPGMQAPGLYVVASRGDGAPVAQRVDREGRYRFAGLTPGNWRVEGRLKAVNTELLYVARHPDDAEFRWNATVVDHETLELDVDMGHLGEVEIHGELRIDGAAPPPGWTVEAMPPFHKRFHTQVPKAELDGDGRFVLTARPGRTDLILAGPMPGGARIEVLREVQLRGPRLDWEESVQTGAVEEVIDGKQGQVRFVHGLLDQGDRELATVPVGPGGVIRARVPLGPSSLQLPTTDEEGRPGWEALRLVEVK